MVNLVAKGTKYYNKTSYLQCKSNRLLDVSEPIGRIRLLLTQFSIS
jgi:hypothetical protein